MQISFRAAVESDFNFLYSVYRSTRLDEPGISSREEMDLEGFLQQQFQLKHAQYRANYPEGRFDVILTGETPVGHLYVNRGQTEIRLIDIALLPSFRRQGIGSRIMEGLVAESERTGIPLTLYVEYNNPVKAHYKSLGFIEKGEPGVYQFMERPLT